MADLDLEQEEELQEAQERLARQLQLEEADDVSQLLKSPAFRRFVWAVLVEAKVGPHDYVGSSDPLDIGKWMGERHVGHFILNKLLTADPLVYTTLYKEALLREKNGKDFVNVDLS